tara:strand:+ start:2816 stop:3751 length:936 start_codon:yes stop_codon:yes gene_type:complete
MANQKKTDLLIIGSGPAGYTAAIYAARAGLNPVLVTGAEPGGQLMITTDVENYPGYENAIQGPWLMEQMEKQAKNVGTEIIFDYINTVDFSKTPFTCKGDINEYVAKAVIVCTGAKARWLGLESEEKFKGFGVSACATCDGIFFKGQDVAVIGGGNSAVEEAIYLSKICNSVTLIHRRDKLRSEKVLQDKLLNTKNIKVEWNHELDEVLGKDGPKAVTGLRLKSTLDSKTKEIKVDGLFVAIGHDPATEIFKGKLDMDSEGYLVVEKGGTKTSVKGIFAAGDVQDKVYRQAVTAAGQGCMAALEVEKFLQE